MADETAVATEREALDAYSMTVTAVAQQVLPAVASLRVRRGSRSFEGGAGSGVVITSDGFLVTSAHVVAQAGAASASFIDGSEYELDVVGADPLSDLAVARARAATLEPIQIGNADNLRVGQLVVAIGNPMGFSGSVTSGVVSGLGRSLATADGNGHRRFIEDVIQTDAALNPGNSGGALADWQARLVGVNTAVAGMGLGLAVPINKTTQAILSALMRNGRVRRAFLGIAGGTRPLPPAVA
ncbi:MAG: trypsin-like serine protease, partial [Chloroflexi bacterium]